VSLLVSVSTPPTQNNNKIRRVSPCSHLYATRLSSQLSQFPLVVHPPLTSVTNMCPLCARDPPINNPVPTTQPKIRQLAAVVLLPHPDPCTTPALYHVPSMPYTVSHYQIKISTPRLYLTRSSVTTHVPHLNLSVSRHPVYLLSCELSCLRSINTLPQLALISLHTLYPKCVHEPPLFSCVLDPSTFNSVSISDVCVIVRPPCLVSSVLYTESESHICCSITMM
jgi:hypothetical protein